jgi:hypothetical protein
MKCFVAALSLCVFCPVAASQTGTAVGNKKEGASQSGLPGKGSNSTPGIVPDGAGSRVKWEYAILSREDITKRGAGDFVAGLNKLGDEGWELISITGPRGAPRAEEALFKRLKESSRGATGGLNFRGGERPGGAPNWRGQPGKGQPGKGRVPAGPAEISNVIGKATGGSKGTEKEVTNVIFLKHAKAASLQKILEDLYGQKNLFHIATDERTNSIILVGVEEALIEIQALLQKLDGPEDAKKAK